MCLINPRYINRPIVHAMSSNNKWIRIWCLEYSMSTVNWITGNSLFYLLMVTMPLLSACALKGHQPTLSIPSFDHLSTNVLQLTILISLSIMVKNNFRHWFNIYSRLVYGVLYNWRRRLWDALKYITRCDVIIINFLTRDLNLCLNLELFKEWCACGGRQTKWYI